MSRLSIYETRWIDLVFENKNKEYGAYQMRRDSVKSSLTALFMGLLFVASIGVISTVASHFKSDTAPVDLIPEWSEPIKVTDILVTPEPKTEAASSQAPTQNIIEIPVTQEVFRNPIIVNPNEATPDIPVTTEIKNTTSSSSESVGMGNSTASDGYGSGTGSGTGVTPEVDYGTSIVGTSILDKMPQFPGGMEKFYKYISNNFERPEIDASNIIKVYVSFVIEKDGSMTDIKVNRDPGYGLGREAVRVLKSLKTKWTPGIINSKPVRTAYNLPISIQMQ